MKKHKLQVAILLLIISIIFTLYKTNILKEIALFGIRNLASPNESSEKSPKLLDNNNKDMSDRFQPRDKPKIIKEVEGLVLVSDLDNSILIDLKYATTGNFTGKIVYPAAVCLLQRETAQKLVKVNAEFKKNGYKIKIWDAYRPVYVQKIFWDIVKDSRFVANPANGGSIHNRGTAVDLTLVDANGKEILMPSKFDDFSDNAFRHNTKINEIAKKNMDYLTDIMKKNGFNTIESEWWHYEDNNFAKYKIVDVDLQQFDNKNEISLDSYNN